ncbi:MAG TPA: diguanylate cyclase [Candidatus Nanopelagicaceae bacterium]|nr:diguanylate cyclase [Candidatus Nanopelagicaceae bacterium]HVC22899.1 diguanylate cyclase [Candidatus Dormibacteraeota bacterium]
MGGDNFIVILPDTDQEEAARLAQRLESRVAGRIMIVDGRKVRIPSWSAEIAVWADDGTEVDTLLRASEAQLFARKQIRASGSRFE